MRDNAELSRTKVDAKPREEGFSYAEARHMEAIGRVGALVASGLAETRDGEEAVDRERDAADRALHDLMVCPVRHVWQIARKVELLEAFMSMDPAGLCNDRRELRWLAAIRIDLLGLVGSQEE